MRLLMCLLILCGDDTFGMDCQNLPSFSSGSDWACEHINWWNTLQEWKREVENVCPNNTLEEYWKSTFVCPDFSAIKCTDPSSRRESIDSFNCRIIICDGGCYTESDTSYLTEIWLHSFTVYKNITSRIKNELRDCTRTCPDDEISTMESKTILSTNSPRTEAPAITQNNDEVSSEVLSTEEISAAGTTASYTTSQPNNDEVSSEVMSTEEISAAGTTASYTTSQPIINSTCSEGWMIRNSSCYYFSYNTATDRDLSWLDARLQCEKMHSNLVIIEDEAEHEYVWSHSGKSHNTFIGLSDLGGVNAWEWVDGIPLTYSNWHSIEPNDYQGTPENCAELKESYDGLWNDAPCDNLEPYVCEKRVDLDKTINGYTVKGWNLSRNFIYKVFTDHVDYATATSSCDELGGTLAAEVLRHPDAVRDIINSEHIGDYRVGDAPWVGFDDLQMERNWVWIDGGEINPSTTEWDYRQPDDSGGNEDCGHIWVFSANKILLNDIPCQMTQSYVCEINVNSL